MHKCGVFAQILRQLHLIHMYARVENSKKQFVMCKEWSNFATQKKERNDRKSKAYTDSRLQLSPAR